MTNESLPQPLKLVAQLDTKSCIFKILRVGHELILGLSSGHLQVYDIAGGIISHTKVFKEGEDINDIVAMDDTQYLLATNEGLMKTTKK